MTGSDSPAVNDDQHRAAFQAGSLQSRNIRIHKRRTSVRLEREMWSALNEIAALEGSSVHEVCSAVHDLKEPAASFTAALRVFMMEYYRSAARTDGQVSRVQRHLKKAGGAKAYAPFQGISGVGGV